MRELKRVQAPLLLLQELPHDAPVAILLPGLTGGSGDSYVQVLMLFTWLSQ